MLQGHKILMTGPAGSIAFPLSRELARHNEVWGIARFRNQADREQVEAIGVRTRQIDLASGDFSDLPDDFDYVLHLAAYLSPGADYDAALRVQAEGSGLLLTHCRKAKAALVMSTAGVYRPHTDPWHAYVETDPLGDTQLPGMPYYGLTKVAEEGVARFCARQLGLPVTIARMNAQYGDGDWGHGGKPAQHFEAIRAGRPIIVRWEPNPYSLIHDQDIFDQLPDLLGAASTSATIVNWGGDEAVPAQDWIAYIGELLGREPSIVFEEFPGTQRGVVADNTRRLSITGPAKVGWRAGIKRMVEARLRRSAAQPARSGAFT